MRRRTMRRLVGAAVAVCAVVALAAGARAQSLPQKVWTAPSPLRPLGYCQLAGVSAATALSACSGGIPAGATLAVVEAESNAVRWRDDGTAPTASIGMPLAVLTPLNVTVSGLSNWQAIPETATATIDVSFYGVQ